MRILTDLSVCRIPVRHINITVSKRLIFQTDINIFDLFKLKSIRRRHPRKTVRSLDIIRVSSENKLIRNRRQIRACLKIVFLCRIFSYDNGIRIVLTIQPYPRHIEFFFVFFLKFCKHLIIAYFTCLMSEHKNPSAGCIFRIEIKLSLFHCRLDIARSSADTFCKFYFITCLLLDKLFQHFSEDKLLCHRLCGDLNRFLSFVSRTSFFLIFASVSRASGHRKYKRAGQKKRRDLL